MEENYQSIELVVKLMAKTGLFFASVDGEYADSERIFIENYINQLSKVGPVDEVKDMLENALNQHFTLGEIIADTRQLLTYFAQLYRAGHSGRRCRAPGRERGFLELGQRAGRMKRNSLFFTI